jgi:hypothetical protein
MSMMRPPRHLHALLVVTLAGCTASQVRYAPLAAPPAVGDSVEATLYLVGDGGEVNPHRDAVLDHLRADVRSVARDGAGPPVVVAFLGDNIYDEGAPLEQTDEDVEKLAGQVLALAAAPNVQGIFLPGNHDWANGASLDEGREAISRQRQWVAAMSEGRNVRFLPEDGCPGPVTESLGAVATLVFIDTEWALRSPDGTCGSTGELYERLAAELREHRDRPVVLLSHHPLASGGPHGGNVAPLENGPLVYYLATKSGVIQQDLASPAYVAMRRGIADAIAASGAPPLIHAAGHDHTLQVIRMAGSGEPRYQVVSGALAKTSRVRRIRGTRYATDGYGYVRLDFAGGRVRLVVFARDAQGGPVRPVFACTLSQAAPAEECPEAPLATDGV